jgi:hypothetical protein
MIVEHETGENPRKVRPYTPEEMAVLEHDPRTKEEKLARILARISFDIDRYQSAAKEHTDMAPHFERLIRVSTVAAGEWAKHYHEEYGVPIQSIPVPYSGTEGALDMPAMVIMPQGTDRADLPA